MPWLDFGFSIPLTTRGGTLAEMLAKGERLLAAADAHGLTAWFVDHLQSGDRPMLECFATLAHITGRYPALRVGTLVVGQGYRNPALTAKIAVTLHTLTNGRFILGLGAGWKEDEYRAYGYPFPPAGERVAQLDEAARIIKVLWREAPASFAGRYYQVAEAHCAPRPEPPPLLMIGGGGERRTLRVVAEHADWWNADYYSPDDYARKLEVLAGYCRAIGRDVAEITPTTMAGSAWRATGRAPCADPAGRLSAGHVRASPATRMRSPGSWSSSRRSASSMCNSTSSTPWHREHGPVLGGGPPRFS